MDVKTDGYKGRYKVLDHSVPPRTIGAITGDFVIGFVAIHAGEPIGHFPNRDEALQAVKVAHFAGDRS